MDLHELESHCQRHGGGEDRAMLVRRISVAVKGERQQSTVAALSPAAIAAATVGRGKSQRQQLEEPKEVAIDGEGMRRLLHNLGANPTEQELNEIMTIVSERYSIYSFFW